MKINKYRIGAAGAVLVIILIIVFVQRSDWNKSRFILSADSEGNLNPVSESYFESNEKKHIDEVGRLMNKLNLTYVKPVRGPNVQWRGVHQGHASFAPHDAAITGGCERLRAGGGYDCPLGTFGIGVAGGPLNGRCGCAYFKG
jgi:hypothetical protein